MADCWEPGHFHCGIIFVYYTLGTAEQSDWSICTTWPSRKNRYWTARFDVDPEAAASSRVVAKSHSPRFQTYTKEQQLLLPILDDKDSKNPQASKRVGDKDIWTFLRRERVGNLRRQFYEGWLRCSCRWKCWVRADADVVFWIFFIIVLSICII